MAAAPKTHGYEIDIEDVEYLRHGDTALLARLFKPRGQGPFPALVELHGGAWCMGDRLNDTTINENLARAGIVVAALDFRVPPVASYPASLMDINYGIRWMKSQAESLRTRPDMVCTFGISSGGHQAMLLGMRPRDSRYASIALAGATSAPDATVRGVIMGAPVIDPIGRYRYAKQLKESGKPYPEFVDMVLPLHDKYWKTEDAMSEGSPLQALERGDRVELPPVLYIQDSRDIVHPRPQLERFVELYRKAGGPVDLEFSEGAADAFAPRNPPPALGRMYEKRDPSSASGSRTLERIISFIRAQTGWGEQR
ncbi:MAG TPA: alpha/beta hydrolase [Candidatus Binataceae bacterium]|nr:alpha/beta hydrolase [Candidatus Binataceae bacterium]